MQDPRPVYSTPTESDQTLVRRDVLNIEDMQQSGTALLAENPTVAGDTNTRSLLPPYKRVKRIRLQSNTVTGMLICDMANKHNGATETELLNRNLPAGVITAFNASRFRRIWTTLFDHYAGRPEYNNNDE